MRQKMRTSAIWCSSKAAERTKKGIEPAGFEVSQSNIQKMLKGSCYTRILRARAPL